MLQSAIALISIHADTSALNPLIEQEEPQIIPAIDSEFLYLEIKQSLLPVENAGWGVFAKIDIPALEILCEYRGAIIPAHVPYSSAYAYTLRASGGENIVIIPDSNKPVCAYINDCVDISNHTYTEQELLEIEQGTRPFPVHTGYRHNAHPVNTFMGKAFILSSTLIKANTEICLSYGVAYWVERVREQNQN